MVVFNNSRKTLKKLTCSSLTEVLTCFNIDHAARPRLHNVTGHVRGFVAGSKYGPQLNNIEQMSQIKD